MSSSKARIVLPKDALRQLAKLGMDPAAKKDPLSDASIVKWSTVVVPIANKALVENSANMMVEGKSESAAILQEAASAISEFGVRASSEPGLSGAERAQATIEDAKSRTKSQELAVAELKRKISEASGSSESTVQTRSRQVEDAELDELRKKLETEIQALNQLRCTQSAWETVDVIIYSTLSLVIGETKLHDSNIARRALRDHDSAQEAGGFSVQTGTGLMKEIEKQMSAHFVTLIREVEILLQPNNAYWRELFLAPRTLSERIKDMLRAREALGGAFVTPRAEPFAAQMMESYSEMMIADGGNVYMDGYRTLLEKATMTGSTMSLKEFAEEIKALCDMNPTFYDRKPTSAIRAFLGLENQAFQVATRNGPGTNAPRPKPPASRPGHRDSIYPPGEEVGCRRCHQLTHYARDCPETLAARERRAARRAARN